MFRSNIEDQGRRGFVYEERAYRKCSQCNECVKALLFTEIMVCSISSLFYLVVFGISLPKQHHLPIHLVTISLQFITIAIYVLTLKRLKRRFP